MAEAKDAADERPPAVLQEVPTEITSNQIIAVILTLAACRYAAGILAPLLVAVLLAVALAPIVATLSRVLPRWIAAAIVVNGIAAVFLVTAWSLSDEAAAFSKQLPSMVREMRSTIQSASPRQSLMRQLQQAVTELEETTTNAKPADATPVTIVATTDVQRQVMSYAQTAVGYLGAVVLLMFLVYFLLAAGDLFKKKLVRLSGERLSQKKVTVQMLDEMVEQIGHFVFYQFWSGAVVGVATWLVFAWIGVKYAGLWGVAAGVLNAIPYFGPTIVLFGSAAAAMLQFKSIPTAILVAAASVAITSIEGFLLMPIELGRKARANSVAVFVSVMFWGWLWGALGLILAVPILMIVKTVADHVESLSGLSELLSDRIS